MGTLLFIKVSSLLKIVCVCVWGGFFKKLGGGIPLPRINTVMFISVGNNQLHGASQKEAAYVQQWINFADNEILPASCTWVFPCLGITQFNKQVCTNYFSRCCCLLQGFSYLSGVGVRAGGLLNLGKYRLN